MNPKSSSKVGRSSFITPRISSRKGLRLARQPREQKSGLGIALTELLLAAPHGEVELEEARAHAIVDLSRHPLSLLLFGVNQPPKKLLAAIAGLEHVLDQPSVFDRDRRLICDRREEIAVLIAERFPALLVDHHEKAERVTPVDRENRHAAGRQRRHGLGCASPGENRRIVRDLHSGFPRFAKHAFTQRTLDGSRSRLRKLARHEDSLDPLATAVEQQEGRAATRDDMSGFAKNAPE
jgi:hypothetical protein